MAQLEAGDANISLERLDDLARALEIPLEELVREPSPSRQVEAPKSIALLGLRGAGKSTIGPKLAAVLSCEFVELDALIESAAGLSLAQIFELHGEAYYRRVEREILARLLSDGKRRVIATGGGVVNDRETFRLLRKNASTVWLRARAEDHWNRVVEQGDHRPMEKKPHAMAELRALLTAREPLYAQAEHTIDPSKLDIPHALKRLHLTLQGANQLK